MQYIISLIPVTLNWNGAANDFRIAMFLAVLKENET